MNFAQQLLLYWLCYEYALQIHKCDFVISWLNGKAEYFHELHKEM